MLNQISQQELRTRLIRFAGQERKLLAVIVEHIAEVDRRKLYLEWKYQSLFDYLTRELRYSESSAYRRMQAARLLHQIPELQEKIEQGELKLSQISQAQSDFKAEEKSLGHKLPAEQKKEILLEICNKSLKETQVILDENLNTTSSKEIEIRHRRQSVRVKIDIPSELFQKLERIKELYSHIHPGANLIELLELMAKDVEKLRDPLLKKTRTKPASTQSFFKSEVTKEHGSSKNHQRTFTRRTPIAAAIKRFIFQRDKGQCQVCESKHQVEVDHILPLHRGGQNEISNLRLLCRAHNAHRNYWLRRV